MRILSNIIPTLSLIASGISAVAGYALTNTTMYNPNATDNNNYPETGGELKPEPIGGAPSSIAIVVAAGTMLAIAGAVACICDRQKKAAAANAARNQTEDTTEDALDTQPSTLLAFHEDTNNQMMVTGDVMLNNYDELAVA